MDKIEPAIRQDEDTVIDVAEKLKVYQILIWLQKKNFYINL